MHQGRKAKELREERGWTQEQLRDKFNQIGRRMTRSNISLMESREWLEGELIADLSKVFGVPPGVFFEETTPPGETREEMIDRAFEFVRRDRSVKFGSAIMAKLPADAKLAIIRMYEELKHVRLLPDEVA